MKFQRIYIELTEVCGLKCTFCPSGPTRSQVMPLDFFASIVAQASRYTRQIVCHVLGDPLTRPDLVDYLDIIDKHRLQAILTTSGYFLKKQPPDTLFHPAVRQINVSLNAFNKNQTGWSLAHYLDAVSTLCEHKASRDSEAFVNLRLWNLDAAMSERSFNQRVIDALAERFAVELDVDQIYAERPRSIRLAPKVRLHFDDYFEWPALHNPRHGDGRCLGLSSHIAVLCDGTVVPCCLDCDGVIALGDLHQQSLEQVLRGQRAQHIRAGFAVGKAVETLCQHCSYKQRFATHNE